MADKQSLTNNNTTEKQKCGNNIDCIFMPIQDYPNIAASIIIRHHIDNCTNITIMFYFMPYL